MNDDDDIFCCLGLVAALACLRARTRLGGVPGFSFCAVKNCAPENKGLKGRLRNAIFLRESLPSFFFQTRLPHSAILCPHPPSKDQPSNTRAGPPVSRPTQRAIMSRIAIDSANASGIGIPPATAEMPSLSQPAPTAIAAAAPRSTIPTSATPLQKQQFKNQIISPNRANAAVALSALFRSEPAPAEVANASAIVAQQVCPIPCNWYCFMPHLNRIELNTIAIFAEFIGPSTACACFLCCARIPDQQIMRCTYLQGKFNCKRISNGQQHVIHFYLLAHSISRVCSSHLKCQATPKEDAQQQLPPPQPQQQSSEGAAFNNMAPMASAAPGYPYAMSQAAAAPGAQGMSFIMQVRRFHGMRI